MIEHVLLALLVTPPAGEAPAEPPTPGVEIRAPVCTTFARESRAVCTGGVTVQRGTTTLTCDRLTAWYAPAGGVQRVACEGHVEATDGERSARGERATFAQASGVLEVTGDPEARQGPHQLRGRLVRFHVGTDRLEVEQAETVLQAAPRGPPRGRAGREPGPPVRVSAPLLRVLDREGRAVYSGGVTAQRGETQMRCRRLTALYTPGTTATDTPAGGVRQVECVGAVEARDGDRRATGERATFDNAAGTLELTGNPELRQGPTNVTRGRVVRLHVDTDTVEVEQAESVLDPSSARDAQRRGP